MNDKATSKYIMILGMVLFRILPEAGPKIGIQMIVV